MKKNLLFMFFLLIGGISMSQNTWVQKADFGGGTGRFGAAGFSIGTIGYIGMGTDAYPGYNWRTDFWGWDQSTNTWTQEANFGGVGRYAFSTFAIGTKGYVGCGWDGNYYNDFWVYDQSSNTWTQLANFGSILRTAGVGFSIGAKGYMGMGYSDIYGELGDIWEYDTTTTTWTQKADFPSTPRFEPFYMVIDSFAYVGCGADNYPNINCTHDVYKFDPVANTWTQVANYPGGNRQELIAFSINHLGYVGTGADSNYISYRDFYQYDPIANLWTQIANYPDTVTTHGAVGFSIGLKGYVGCGMVDLNSTMNLSFWEYTPGPLCNLSVTTQETNAMCNTCANGWAVAIPSGGTAPYTYSWSSTPIQTTQSASGLLPGNYTVNVTDSNNCNTSSIVTIGNANVCGASYLLYPDTNIAHTYFIVNQSWGVSPIHYDWNWGDSTAHD